jgi:integrase
VKIISADEADELYRRLPERSKLIFAIAFETGLRISDILWLKVSCVENPMYFAVGKTRRTLKLQLSEWLYDELKHAAKFRLPDAWLFPSRTSKSGYIHRTTYHRDIKRATAGLPFDCSAHSTRKFHYYSCGHRRRRNSTAKIP